MSHVSSPLIFLIAGEASGDQLGADLMVSLRKMTGVRFAGIGGPAMAAQGLTSLFPMEELSLMGVMGILRQLPHLLRRLSYTIETIQQLKPDVVITIDAQEFSYRVMKRLHKVQTRPRLIQYVAPTVWAWRPGRARKLAAVVDRLLCLYPFEPSYFEKYGLNAKFVGHPVAAHTQPPSRTLPHKSGERDTATQEALRKGPDYDGANAPHNNSKVLCLLPGSRRSEIQTLLPIFAQTVQLLHQDLPSLKIIIPTLLSMKHLIEQGTQGWPLNVDIIVGAPAQQVAFQKASVALAASGTVALQLAAAGLPFIVAYKVGKINEWIAKALLKTPWVCMVNILLAFRTFGSDFVLNKKMKEKVKEPWIPEFLQENCTPENLKTALLKLLNDPDARAHQEQAMDQAIDLLKVPTQTAAENVLEEIDHSLRSKKTSHIL